MRKIPTLFVRDPETNLRTVKNEIHPGCQWVTAGCGTATRKYDGTCVLIRGGIMYARREIKPGKLAPPDFEVVSVDATTGKTVGWVPVGDEPEWARHHEAYGELWPRPNGTYELVGPKVNGNPEGFSYHELVPHGRYVFLSHRDSLPELDESGLPWSVDPDMPPRGFDGLRGWLLGHDFEGVVWWAELGNVDAPMAKLKKRDFL